MTSIAIIGTGLTGLTLAHFLSNRADITLFDKASGVGGRLSTRRATPYAFDHGAQYFTVRTKAFHNFIQPLVDCNIIAPWSPRYVKFSGSKIIEKRNWQNEAPRYVGVPGMNQVAKSLALGLNVKVKTNILSLKYQQSWQLIDQNSQYYTGFDWVICCMPSPQTADLLPCNFSHQPAIKSVKMQGCFAVMLGFTEEFPMPFEAAHVTDSDLSWIAINSHKPNRPSPFALVIHSSEEYAATNLNQPDDSVIQHIVTEASRLVGSHVHQANHRALHRWRYANNAIKNQTFMPFIDQHHKLAVAGDWCQGGRVEGAFTAAFNLANELKKMIV